VFVVVGKKLTLFCGKLLLASQSLLLVLGALLKLEKVDSVFFILLRNEMEPEGLEKVLLLLLIKLLFVLVKKLFVGFIEVGKLLLMKLVLVFVPLLKKLLSFPNEPEKVFKLLLVFTDVDTGVWPIGLEKLLKPSILLLIRLGSKYLKNSPFWF
jgi:hypothetical protein